MYNLFEPPTCEQMKIFGFSLMISKTRSVDFTKLMSVKAMNKKNTSDSLKNMLPYVACVVCEDSEPSTGGIRSSYKAKTLVWLGSEE